MSALPTSGDTARAAPPSAAPAAVAAPSPTLPRTSPADSPLRPFLDRQGVMILDGGLATELEARGCLLNDALWSARLLADGPDRIAEVHAAYLEVGADCITAASYQATFEGFARRGCSDAEAVALLQRSVTLARRARDELWAAPENRRGRLRPLVAASIGPYGAFLADGSEYRGDYGLSEAALADFHRRRLQLLAAAGADLLACETLPSAAEARALAGLLRVVPGTCAWMSFTLAEEGDPASSPALTDGTPLAELAAELDAEPSILALGVNCVPPSRVSAALSALAGATSKPLLAYPNSGERWDAAERRWLPAATEPDLATAAPVWHALGARLLGGCCRTRPAHIRQLREALAPA